VKKKIGVCPLKKEEKLNIIWNLWIKLEERAGSLGGKFELPGCWLPIHWTPKSGSPWPWNREHDAKMPPPPVSISNWHFPTCQTICPMQHYIPLFNW